MYNLRSRAKRARAVIDEAMEIDEQVDELNLYANLPALVLHKIFRYLNTADLARAGRVCLQWYHTSKDAALWKVVSVNGLDLTASRVEKLILRLPPCILYLRLQCVRCPRKQTDPIFTAAMGNKLKSDCPNLKTLIIENALLTTYKSELDFDVECLPDELQVLSLRGSIFRTDFFFSNVDACKYIKVMDFTACLCVRDHQMTWFSRLLHLEELYLAGCPISSVGLTKLFDYSVTRNCVNKIKVLDLEGTDIGDNVAFILQNGLQNIKELYLSRTKITTGDFIHMGYLSFPKLRTICLQHVPSPLTLINSFAKVQSLKCIRMAVSDASIGGFDEVDIDLSQKFQVMDDSECSSYCNHFKKKHLECK